MGRRLNYRFTPYPRWWRAFLPILGNAELRVLAVIIEQTAGWSRKSAVLSIRKIAALAGLNKANVPKALKALISAGVVAQRVQGNRKVYSIQDLGEEAEWARYAHMVVQRVHPRPRKADKASAQRVQQAGVKHCPQRVTASLETEERDPSRDKEGGALRRREIGVRL